MKKFLCLMASLALLASCGICRYRHTIEYRDSVRVEYRDSLIYRDSIIYVALPVEESMSHLFLGDTSRLETSLAESVAWADSSGLHHTLRNKQRDWGVKVPVITRVISDKAHKETAEIRPVTLRVEKPLSWWQRLKIGAFPWLLGLCLALVLWTFRKTILW